MIYVAMLLFSLCDPLLSGGGVYSPVTGNVAWLVCRSLYQRDQHDANVMRTFRFGLFFV
jgi:hypothetical protein